MGCNEQPFFMRIAFVTSLVPTRRAETGFELASESLLQGLKAEGHQVTIFGFKRPDETASVDHDIVVLSDIVIETAMASRALKAQWVLKSLAKRLPLAVAKLQIITEQSLLDHISAQGPFDALIINAAQMAAAFPALFSLRNALFLAHNVEHQSARQNAAESTGLKAFAYGREARLLDSIENSIMAKARFVWFLSDDDRQAFGESVSKKSTVLPLLLPEAPALPDGPAEHDLGLIGTWSWRPNGIGLEWFLREVVPLLPADLSIAIAGRTPDTLRSARSNIRFLGRVPDANAFLASCRVMALASRIGTGIQLKSIEILQRGKAAVATSVALRGISARPASLAVADDAADFAKACIAMVEAVREGRVASTESASFVETERTKMAEAIKLGLSQLA
jgi:glycosyltransferase involved in cell wall biosynthesis